MNYYCFFTNNNSKAFPISIYSTRMSLKKIKSKIDSTKKVEYSETRVLNRDDIQHETTIYETDILGMPVAISLGRPDYTYNYRNVVYFPIYLMRGDVVRSQIGVYELRLDELIRYSRNGIINMEMIIADIDPLLYSFADNEYIAASGSDPKLYFDVASPKTPDDVLQEEEPSEESKVTDLQVRSPIVAAAASISPLFELDKHADIPKLLKEELKPERGHFNDNGSVPWIQKFMESHDFRIVKTTGDGDCFFTAIQKAFHQIGQNTTVPKLRQAVADSLNVDIFEQYSLLYNMYVSEVAESESNIEKSNKAIMSLKRRYRNIPETNKEARQAIIAEIKSINEKIDGYKADLVSAKQNRGEYSFMTDVKTLDDLRVAVQDKGYWADEHAITVLEKRLNTKFIILSEKSFRAKSLDSVMQCQVSGARSDSALANPDYYIMLSYTGDHYDLISYKDKNIFVFSEIPYIVKTLIVNKCIERNAGTFGLIPDFLRFQERKGISIDSAVEDTPNASNPAVDATTVFMFHKTSAHEKPGKGSGESIELANIPKYGELSKIKDWRRALADETPTIFTLDGKRWQTVTHYILASQFKSHSAFFGQFSLDSDSDLSKDLEVATGASSKTGMYKKTQLRPKEIKPDPQFFEGRDKEARTAALNAKFRENADANKVLILTRDATLKHFIRGSPAETDDLLMEVRRGLSK